MREAQTERATARARERQRRVRIRDRIRDRTLQTRASWYQCPGVASWDCCCWHSCYIVVAAPWRIPNPFETCRNRARCPRRGRTESRKAKDCGTRLADTASSFLLYMYVEIPLVLRGWNEWGAKSYKTDKLSFYLGQKPTAEVRASITTADAPQTCVGTQTWGLGPYTSTHGGAVRN